MHKNLIGQKLEESDVRFQKVTRKCPVRTLHYGYELRLFILCRHLADVCKISLRACCFPYPYSALFDLYSISPNLLSTVDPHLALTEGSKSEKNRKNGDFLPSDSE